MEKKEMNEWSGSGWFHIQAPWLFFKSEITLKSIQSDPGDNDGKHFDTNEPWVIWNTVLNRNK